MNFAVPSALWWAALALPIIGLYILKVRLRRVPTSTTMFWNQIYDEKPPRSIWETLKHLLSLLAQILMLLFLVLAIADPYFSWQLQAARRVVLIIDNSASMQATDVDDDTRLAAALDEARRLTDGLRFRDEMAVILAGSQPQVLTGMTGHVPTLKRTLDDIEPSDGPTDPRPAIELGRRLIGDHPHGQIVLLTDGRFEGADELASDELVDLRIFGTEAPNLGITQFQVRRSLIDPLGYEVLAAVKNASAEETQCRLELELDGVPVDVLPLTLAAEETWSRALEKTSLEGGTLTARLVRPNESEEGEENEAAETDPLPADDTAWAILPPREMQRVLLVTPGNLFLQKVFEANPLVDVRMADTPPDEWPADVITVLHQIVPDEMPPGDVLVVDPRAGSDLWELGGDLDNPIVTQQDAESPLMTHVKLDNVTMAKARELTFTDSPHVLAEAVSGDPLYARIGRASGDVLVLTVDLEASDLAFRTTFPIMVTNALGWFAGGSGELNRSLPTGTITQLTLSAEEVAGSRQLVLRSPDGNEQPLNLGVDHPDSADDEATVSASSATEGNSPEDFTITIGPLEQAGVWEIVRPAESEQSEPTVLRSIACNIADAGETDLRVPEQLTSEQNDSSLAAAWMSRPIWFYLIALAVLFTAIEWWMYQRRVIR